MPRCLSWTVVTKKRLRNLTPPTSTQTSPLKNSGQCLRSQSISRSKFGLSVGGVFGAPCCRARQAARRKFATAGRWAPGIGIVLSTPKTIPLYLQTSALRTPAVLLFLLRPSPSRSQWGRACGRSKNSAGNQLGYNLPSDFLAPGGWFV